MHRRAFLATTAAAGLLAACGGGPPAPGTVTVTATAAPGMNPAPDGTDRPVTLSLLRLKDAGAFNSADFFALQEDAAGVLAADLVGMDQLAVAPGGSAAKTLTFEPEATQLGLMASLRDPTGRVWRAAVPVAPGTNVTANVTLGPTGIGLAVS
jgi:type VI secretion system protein VasD